MTKTAWRYEIKYGPEGEANYAWVYDADGEMVCTAKTHHAEAIVTRMNATASLQGEDAVERVELPLARAINDVLNAMVDAQEEMTTTKISARILGNGAVRAILATSLVPDEVAIRADHVRRLEDLLKRVLALGETGGWRRMPDQALFSSLPLAEDIKAAIRSGGGK